MIDSENAKYMSVGKSIALCFRLLDPKAEVTSEAAMSVAPTVRILGIVAFATTVVAMYTSIIEYAYGYAYEGYFTLVVQALGILYIVDVIMLKLKECIISCCISGTSKRLYEYEPLLIPYCFFMWIACIIVTVTVVYTGSYLFGYIILTLMQYFLSGTVKTLALSLNFLNDKTSQALRTKFFIAVNIGGALMLVLCRYGFFIA